jgi:V/A-type H+-transporting ATPase subunit I
MSRLLIVASRDRMAPVVAELYRHHLFHIEEFVEAGAVGYEGFKIGTPLSGASEASVDLVKIRAIENATSIHGDDIDSAKTCTRIELKSRIERELPLLEKEVEDLIVRSSQLDTRVTENEQKIAEIRPFLTVPVDLDLYRGYSGFVVFAGYVAREVKLSVPCEISYSPGKDKNFIVIVAPAGQRSEVEWALQEAAFQPVQIPEESGAPQARIDYYSAEISTMKTEIEEIIKKLDAVRTKHSGFLVACEEFLKAEVEQTEAPLRFATTKQTFVAEGWVPSDRVDAVTADLVKATDGKIYVTVLPIDFEHDSVPVEYNNPSFAKPTQVLMDVYSRPKYTELDPTLLVSIVFPIFFGLILGDVGYGLILLAMSLGLRKFLKGEEGRYLLTVLRNASISSIFFGLLFSEFLGFAIPGLKPILPSRHLMVEHGGHGPMIPDLMILSIWILFHSDVPGRLRISSSTGSSSADRMCLVGDTNRSSYVRRVGAERCATAVTGRDPISTSGAARSSTSSSPTKARGNSIHSSVPNWTVLNFFRSGAWKVFNDAFTTRGFLFLYAAYTIRAVHKAKIPMTTIKVRLRRL